MTLRVVFRRWRDDVFDKNRKEKEREDVNIRKPIALPSSCSRHKFVHHSVLVSITMLINIYIVKWNVPLYQVYYTQNTKGKIRR